MMNLCINQNEINELIHSGSLQIQLALQGTQLGAQGNGILIKSVHPGRCQPERGLSLFDLLIDRLHVPGKVIRLKGQRYHQITERLAHSFSPAYTIKSVVVRHPAQLRQRNGQFRQGCIEFFSRFWYG